MPPLPYNPAAYDPHAPLVAAFPTPEPAGSNQTETQRIIDALSASRTRAFNFATGLEATCDHLFGPVPMTEDPSAGAIKAPAPSCAFDHIHSELEQLARALNRIEHSLYRLSRA